MDTPDIDAVAGLIENRLLQPPPIAEQGHDRRINAFGRDVLIYEQELDRDPEWAMNEGGRHFDENSFVFRAPHKIAKRLEELQIPYSVVRGMALFRHGFRRFTEDVDILVTKENLKRIHEHLEGLGYRPTHAHSKHLRDTEFGVKIEFLTTGGYPGDGKPKPIAFPDPYLASFNADGIQNIKLENLIELKLASGMTNAGRLKDLADVMELIKILQLPPGFSQRLHPYVRDKFQELSAQSKTRYVMLWQNNPSTVESRVLLEAMLSDGVLIEDGSLEEGHARLITDDRNVAEKYGLIEESELWNDENKD